MDSTHLRTKQHDPENRRDMQRHQSTNNLLNRPASPQSVCKLTKRYPTRSFVWYMESEQDSMGLVDLPTNSYKLTIENQRIHVVDHSWSHLFLVKEENDEPFRRQVRRSHPLRCMKEPHLCFFWLVSSYKTCLNTGRNRSVLLFLAFLYQCRNFIYIPQLLQIAPFHSQPAAHFKDKYCFNKKNHALFVVLKVTFAAPPSRLNRVIVPCPSIFTKAS